MQPLRYFFRHEELAASPSRLACPASTPGSLGAQGSVAAAAPAHSPAGPGPPESTPRSTTNLGRGVPRFLSRVAITSCPSALASLRSASAQERAGSFSASDPKYGDVVGRAGRASSVQRQTSPQSEQVMDGSLENARGQSEWPNAEQLPELFQVERFASRASAVLRSRGPHNYASFGVSVRLR